MSASATMMATTESTAVPNSALMNQGLIAVMLICCGSC
jgi:hypothetical protein